MKGIMENVTVIALAIIGIAIIAVLVSQRANTSNVIGAAGDAFTSAIRAATGPVMGGGF